MEKLKLIKKKYEKLIFELILFIAPQPMLNFATPVYIKKFILTNFHFSSFFLSMTLQNAIIQIKFMYKKRGELSK